MPKLATDTGTTKTLAPGNPSAELSWAEHLKRLFEWRWVTALHIVGMLAIFGVYWTGSAIGWPREFSLLVAAGMSGGVLFHAAFVSAWPASLMGAVWVVLAALGIRPEMYVAEFVAMTAAAVTLIVHFVAWRYR
jgi:hypothetical protein